MKDLKLEYCFLENREKQTPAMCPHFNFNNHPAFKMFTSDVTDGYLFCNKADRVIRKVKIKVKINEILERMRRSPSPAMTEEFLPVLNKVIGDIEAPKWCPLKEK